MARVSARRYMAEGHVRWVIDLRWGYMLCARSMDTMKRTLKMAWIHVVHVERWNKQIPDPGSGMVKAFFTLTLALCREHQTLGDDSLPGEIEVEEVQHVQ